MKLLPQSLPRPLTRDFSAILPLVLSRVSPFLDDRQTRTDLATNFIQKSDKHVYGPLHLLAPE